MTYTLPNEADAAFADQAEPHAADIDILVAGLGGVGVVSGCAVTAQGSPDMTVAVAAGVIKVGATQVAVTAANTAAMTADGTHPRFYLIEVTNAGALALNAGTAAANPAKPTPTVDRVVIAEVYIPAADTTIASNQIIDKRVFISPVLRRAIIKTADESVTSSTVMQADNELLVAIGANEVWEFEFIVLFTGATGGDIRVSPAVPSGATGVWTASAGPAVATDTTGSGYFLARVTFDPTGAYIPLGASTNICAARVRGIVTNGATAGNIVLHWTQDTSSGTATIVKAGSFLTASRVV